METLRECLKRADDDYLAGLSNKGTVKRAVKDLEKETPKASWPGTEEGGGAAEAEVSFKEETCRIRVPLGESTCTCPSRSICRHVVAAILWLRKAEESGGTKHSLEMPDERTEAENGPAAKTELPAASLPPTTDRPALSSFFDIPLSRLTRAAQGAGLKALLAHVRLGELPPLEESSVVSVRLPWSGETVKLLEPAAYSSCTCKSRGLCTHKAQAILLYQLAKKHLDAETLLAVEQTDSPAYDREQMQEAAQAVLAALEEQLSIGLSRQSADIPERLERLAVICHRAALARFEHSLRAAAAQYRGFFSRSAVFRDDALLKTLLSLSRLGQELLQAMDAGSGLSSLAALAGSFRSTYEPVGTLHLLGMGVRAFLGQSGYEGETYYFLDPDQKKWYTYTDARPVFYEGVRKRGRQAQESPSPWGLEGSREALCGYELCLTGAKAAPGGRLSASKETRGDILGRRTLSRALPMSFWDYGELLAHFFAAPDTRASSWFAASSPVFGAGRERLALVGAVRWGETAFDPIAQRFSWSLYDAKGSELRIAVSYDKKDGLLISLLERIGKKLARHPPDCLLFLGNIYLDDGRLCLYPIECFLSETEEIRQAMEVLKKIPGDAPEYQNESRKPESHKPQTAGAPRAKAAGQTIPPDAIQTMARYMQEGRRLLTDLFVSGLLSVPEEALETLSALAREGELLGLRRAGRDFASLEGLLSAKRHQMAFTPKPAIRLMEHLDQYLTICQNQISYDKARQLLSAGPPAVQPASKGGMKHEPE